MSRVHIIRCGAIAALMLAVSPAWGNIRITEFMYNSSSAGTGEFVELTNLGSTSVDFTGWSFDDSSGVAGSMSLSAFGVVAPGASVVLTDATAASFIAAWALTDVPVIGGNTNNLSRSDKINIYDASNTLMDRLKYDDQVYSGTPRTSGVSAWANVSGPGPFGIIDSSWTLSALGDVQLSTTSTGGDIGNPGHHIVPESAALSASLSGLLMLRRRRMR